VSFNEWRDQALKSAQAKCQDADRVNFAAKLFAETVERVWRLATTTAIRCDPPKVTRSEDEDSVLLCIEWVDPTSDWGLYIGVIRHRGEKPVVTMGFDGETSYGADSPTDDEIIKALHDYFDAWKGKP
jgi:hypothetical protein